MKKLLIVSTVMTIGWSFQAARERSAVADEPKLTDAEETMRRELIDDANASRTAGDHGKALATAQRALKLRRTPSLELFISKEARETSDFGVAYEQSRLCLFEAKRDKTLHDRDKIIAGCAAVQAAVKDRIAYIVLKLDNPPEGLALKVGSDEVSAAALGSPYVVTPGSVAIEASAPSHVAFHADLEITAGTRKEIVVSLVAKPAPAEPAEPPAADTRAPTGAVVLYPAAAPPDPIPESRPPFPGPGYAWTAGSWDWNGSDWAWTSGYWAPVVVGTVYVGPRYVFVGDRPVYYPGYWQSAGGARRYDNSVAAPLPAALRGTPRMAPDAWRRQAAHNGWRPVGAPPVTQRPIGVGAPPGYPRQAGYNPGGSQTPRPAPGGPPPAGWRPAPGPPSQPGVYPGPRPPGGSRPPGPNANVRMPPAPPPPAMRVRTPPPPPRPAVDPRRRP